VLLEDAPLAVRRDMWFQHDGAPANFRAQTHQHLNTKFPDRWLGSGGPVSWPTRSPDLNPLDFFLWGHLKEIVDRDPTDMGDLTAGFHAAVATIDADMLRRVKVSIPRRAVACRRALCASQALFILTRVNCAHFFCINSLFHECHLQFLCCYSALRECASVSQPHH
jgi:hypothetical protein